MSVMTIDQLDVQDKSVLTRVDFNVPLDGDGLITDDRRIRMALPTIRSIIDRGGRAILMSHLGRPSGTGYQPELGLEVVAQRLGTLLETTVKHVPGSCVGSDVIEAAQHLGNGDVMLLENLRFEAGEKGGDHDFAGELSRLGDLYCNDAFGTSHRADASMVAVAECFQPDERAAGLLLAKEIHFLSDAIESPVRPFVAITGGAKVSDKLKALENLLGKVDHLLVGGAMAYTLLQATGRSVGRSLLEPEMVERAAQILARSEQTCTSIHLPTDHVCAETLQPGVATCICDGDIPEEMMGLDIGPATADRFCELVSAAGTVVWNGPLGAFETPPFDAGTRMVAQSVAEATERGAVTILGGGDTAAAAATFSLDDRFSHISTGGGASLQMLEGEPLPGVEVLR
ncbi:MAG: phosphoglycerate kinase [Phycisphaerae bacterium]|nr:phosphoglycerate kinase [Phycisphaerae bacterium]